MRFFALAMFLSISYIAPIFSYSSLNKSDPCPMFNCVDPQDFLTSNYRAQFKVWKRSIQSQKLLVWL